MVYSAIFEPEMNLWGSFVCSDAAFKQKKATGKRKTTAEESSKPEKSVDEKLKGQRLALSKTFRTALVTEMQMSNAAAEAIVDNVMANATDAELADFS